MRYTQLETHLSKPKNRHQICSFVGSSFQLLTIILLFIILLSVIFCSDNIIGSLLGYTGILSQTSSNSSRIEFVNFLKNEALNRTLQNILTFRPDMLFQQFKPTFVDHQNRTQRCSHHSCFDIYKCETLQFLPEHGKSRYFVSLQKKPKIKVFIYPRRESEEISLEFSRILGAISNSSYYTNNPQKACLFIPNVDLLDSQKLNSQRFETILWSQPKFSQMLGANHLLFSFALPYSSLLFHSPQHLSSFSSSSSHFGFNIGNALVASGAFDLNRYQANFDISIPTYSIFSRLYEDERFQIDSFIPNNILNFSRQFKLISVQANSFLNDTLEQLQKLEYQYRNFTIFERKYFKNVRNISSKRIRFPNKNSQILDAYRSSLMCSKRRRSQIRYIDLLHDSRFCLLLPDRSYFTLSILSDFLMSGCIPIIVIDNLVLPFDGQIDWYRASIRIWSHQLSFVGNIVESIPLKRERNLRNFGLGIWKNFFSSPEVIALKTLDTINKRIFPEMDNNFNNHLNSYPQDSSSERSFSNLSPKSSNLNSVNSGFTTVILSFNRIEQLFEIIALMNKVPSCVKVIVIWNSSTLKPPKKWQNIIVPVEVIQTHSRKLSNRFFPYSSIQTEAIFSLDENITMLNVGEIEFAYQTWLQFPDRIVGFPSRLHVWNNSTLSWHYNSEWRNQVSLILTSAAFYHRYYNFVYTFLQPSEIREWVDEIANCEDIAMNFLISNLTCSAPIKVTPRKKFNCTRCSTTKTKVGTMEHLRKRSDCLERFRQIYGHVPLNAVEFRADPVLFKDNIPDKLKLFSSIGQL